MPKVAAERLISAVFFSDLPATDLHVWGRPSQELRIRRVDPRHTEPYNSGVSPFDQVTPLATSEDAWLAVSQEVEAIAEKLCEARSFCVYLAEGMGGVELDPEHRAAVRALVDNFSSMQMQLRQT